MVDFGSLAAEICWRVWGTPANFNGFHVLAAFTARHSSSRRQPNFAALNRGRHLYSAGRPSRWALAHICSCKLFMYSLYRVLPWIIFLITSKNFFRENKLIFHVVVIMAALSNRAGHYILPCGFFYLFSSFFPRLISAAEHAILVRSPVVDEERMRLGYWWVLVLRDPFIALTRMVGWQEGHPARKKTSSVNPQRFSSGTDGVGAGL